MPMLNGQLTLLGGSPNGGIDDTEAFCQRIVQRAQLDLSYHDREALVSYLVETAWELSLRYRPGGISFSTWAGGTLPKRIIDWQRGDLDHRYHEPQQRPLSLDDDTLRILVAVPDSGSTADRDAALERLWAERHRHRARDLQALRRGLSQASAA